LNARWLSLAEALDLARAHRVKVSVDGGRLIFVGADQPPPAEIVAILRSVGTELAALMPLVHDPWLAADWCWFFTERAAAAERSGLARAAAEAQGFEGCVTEWLNRRFVGSPPDRCCWCGGIERTDENNALLPFGVGPHVWMHSGCWERWRDWRRGEAVAALEALGISQPKEGNGPVSVFFLAERDPVRPNTWRVMCYCGADLFMMGGGFGTETGARAWARWLNEMAEQAEDPLGIDAFSPEPF
jgi:hypothetical protein